MIKGQQLAVLQEKMDVLGPNRKKICKSLGYEQTDKIDVKRGMERVKK